ncbi:neural cell adhesion molecule 2 [Eucyclogobius newberryi]|uniref:neural cell adhesion molecule 2 n=1 Tax=Eucyclogobius newberryi TaxID=166745 RepID=UPI003B5A3C7C
MLHQTTWVPLLLLTALDLFTACPLILNHPELIELGKEALVNCTTTAEGHRGMNLTSGNETSFEDSTSFVLLSIPLVDFDTKAKCTIKLNDTFECSKDLRLNLYKEVQINETAQENNLLELKCEIPDVASVQNLTVTWFMRDQITQTDFYNNSASAAIKVNSSWRKNVSSEYNEANITCEVRMDLEPQGHVFISKTIWNLSVQPATTTTTTTATPTTTTTTTTPPTTTPTTASKIQGCPVTITPRKVVVHFNKSASANCSATEEHDGMGWEATAGGRSLTNDVTHLVWTVKNVDWSVKAGCYINPKKGPQCEVPLDILVYSFTDTVKVSPDGNDTLVEGKPQELKCEFSNVVPREKLQIKWYREDELIATKMFNGSANLALIPKKEHNKANFKCEIELLLGQNGENPKVVSDPYTANVQYKPDMQACQTKYAGKEEELKLDTVPCKANGNPPPVIYWYYNGKLVNSTAPLTRNDSGIYTAKFRNIIGNTSTNVEVTVEYSPFFACQDHYNVTENAPFEATCEPGGIPKPESVWIKGAKQVDFPNFWQRRDGGSYLIVATNKHGQANRTLSINVLYGPSLSEDITEEFHMGENLTLNCSADGNPPPQHHWNHPPAANVNMTTRGRQIYITEATSINAGAYVCSATNEIGSVSRTVTLIMKGTTHSDFPLILIVVLLALLLVLFVIFLLYRNHKKKSGNYDVLALSDSVPLTSRNSVI